MIDDADLQPEVVRSGERPPAPYDNGGSLLPAHCPHVQRAWFTHSVAHRIFALRGLDREAPGPGPGKGRGNCGREESRTEG